MLFNLIRNDIMLLNDFIFARAVYLLLLRLRLYQNYLVSPIYDDLIAGIASISDEVLVNFSPEK